MAEPTPSEKKQVDGGRQHNITPFSHSTVKKQGKGPLQSGGGREDTGGNPTTARFHANPRLWSYLRRGKKQQHEVAAIPPLHKC